MKLGKYTQTAYDTIRREIPMLDHLRPIQDDVQKAYKIVRSGVLLKNIENL